METAFLIMIVLLSLFAMLGMYDGFYLHIFKYELYAHQESRNEHLIHTIRGILFPIILYSCYIATSPGWFYFGMLILLIDVIITIIDAYMEKDSRTFMGGLPRWEYIIHLLVNGFHFASIAVFAVIKVKMTSTGITLVDNFDSVGNYAMFQWLVENLIPGAILMAALHIAVAIPTTATHWNNVRRRVSCC